MSTEAITAPKPAIDWPKPVINDAYEALETTLSKIERLRALLNSNNTDVIDVILPDERTPKFMHTAWMIYVLAEENLEDIENLIAEVIEVTLRDAQFRTSIGKHVDARQRHDWAEAVTAYRAANAATGDGDDVFDAAGDAYDRVLDTRAPNLRCFHEKMTIVNEVGWGNDRAISSLFDDIEALARKHEIAAGAAQAEG